MRAVRDVVRPPRHGHVGLHPARLPPLDMSELLPGESHMALARNSLGHFTGGRTLYYGRTLVRPEPDTGGSPDETWWVLAYDHEPDSEEVRLDLDDQHPEFAFFNVTLEADGETPGSWREILSLIQTHESVEEGEAKRLLRAAESEALEYARG